MDNVNTVTISDSLKPAALVSPNMTWRDALPALLAIIASEEHNDREMAMHDLLRMAQVADIAVALAKQKK